MTTVANCCRWCGPKSHVASDSRCWPDGRAAGRRRSGRLAELPADALLGRSRDGSVDRALQVVTGARILVIGTPVYRASYTGQLKVFFDLLPRDALADTAVGLVATGAGRDHRLAVDHGLRPLVASLAGLSAARAIYLSDAELDAASGEIEQQIAELGRELVRLTTPD